jgi:hypothetical protein
MASSTGLFLYLLRLPGCPLGGVDRSPRTDYLLGSWRPEDHPIEGPVRLQLLGNRSRL